MNTKSPTIVELKQELTRLQGLPIFDERVAAAIALVRAERRPRINELKDQIERLRAKRPAKAPRWPDNTPPEVITQCERYWGGTTELAVFRIHCWNDLGIWTSYPSGGYSCNAGWQSTPSCYHLISRTKLEYRKPKLINSDRTGRQKPAELLAALEALKK